MSKFKIKVARIETVAGAEEDTQVRITFQVEHELASKGITPSGRFSPVQEFTPMPATYPLPRAGRA
jgi:hypothetical protein